MNPTPTNLDPSIDVPISDPKARPTPEGGARPVVAKAEPKAATPKAAAPAKKAAPAKAAGTPKPKPVTGQ